MKPPFYTLSEHHFYRLNDAVLACRALETLLMAQSAGQYRPVQMAGMIAVLADCIECVSGHCQPARTAPRQHRRHQRGGRADHA